MILPVRLSGNSRALANPRSRSMAARLFGRDSGIDQRTGFEYPEIRKTKLGEGISERGLISVFRPNS
jgi:hypothetical protein